MDVTSAFDAGDLSPAELAGAFADLPAALDGQLSQAATDIGERLRSVAADNAPVDTGQLQSSIESVVENVSQSLLRIRVGSNLDHAPVQEFGAGPFFPPPSELRDWARRVLGDEEAAWPVAQSIAESGIEAQPYLKPALEETVAWAVDRINDAVTAAFEDVELQ